MFHLLKFILIILGLAVVAYIALPYFGYEVNTHYFNESKAACQKRIDECTKNLVEQGTQNAKCDFNCVNPTLIIKKQ